MKEYNIKVRTSLKKIIKSVGNLEDSLNETMSGFGFDEKISITSIIPMKLKVERELTNDEKKDIQKIIELNFNDSFGLAQVESFELNTEF